MDKKTVAIIITVAACLLCACPGLLGVFMGVMFAIVSFIPGADIDIIGRGDPRAALNFGITAFVIGIVMVIIAAIVILFVWKKKKNAV